MSDWPKKMWLNEQQTAAFTGPLSGGIKRGTEVLVYPADQAPQPVAHIHLEVWRSGHAWPEDCFASTPFEGSQPVYVAPPFKSAIREPVAKNAETQSQVSTIIAARDIAAIRASEREKCAKVCEANDWSHGAVGEFFAERIRGLGDE